MGQKYMISAFDYPYKGYIEHSKQTRFLIVAVAYFIVWSIKHSGVTMEKRD